MRKRTYETMTDDVKQFVIGSALGDGCFVKKTARHNTYAVFKHCLSQVGYLGWKYDFLSANGYIKSRKGITEVRIKEGSVFPNHQPQFQFLTVSSPDFNFIKTISDDKIVDELGRLALVVWLLDDGNVNGRTIRICAGSKSETLCQKLIEKINNDFGTNAVYYKHPTNPIKNYIRFSTKDYDKLKSLVLEFVPHGTDVVQSKFFGGQANEKEN